MATKSIDSSDLFESYPKETVVEGGVLYQFPERTYRALEMNLVGLSRLKVNLKVTSTGSVTASPSAGSGQAFHIDTLDLYLDRARERFAQVAAERLGSDQSVILPELYTLIEKLDQKRVELLKAKPQEQKSHEMTDEERTEALTFLKSPDLIDRINRDFDASGYIGEETARVFSYVATISRWLKKPLGVLIVSRSGAGKSSLQQAVMRFVPKEHLEDFARLSGKALFYKESLKHKVLAIAEDQGAEEAIYPIRILQSEQKLSVSVAAVDPRTGEKRTEDYLVEGPTSIFWTSTGAERLDFETRNRFAVITIDESPEQTRRILQKQREEDSLEGVLEEEDAGNIVRKHHNAQRLLRPLKVVNPYHGELTYPDHQLLMRREQKKYLALIKAVTLLHQYQREMKHANTKSGKRVDYIEVTLDDIALANKLAADVLGRSLDELSPHTRSLLKKIKLLVDELKKSAKGKPVYFSRRMLIQHTGWSYFQTREPLRQLLEMEYLVMARGEHNMNWYHLVWDGEGEDGQKFFMGLIDTEKLKKRKK